jgi:5-methylcytosine-specific restriction endonuclease McrA
VNLHISAVLEYIFRVALKSVYIDVLGKHEYQNYNKNRWRYNKETMQFYNSSIWRKTSKQVLLANNYVCAVCGGEATMTDHIVSVKKDWSKRLEWDNLQPICKTCNDAKGSWN